MTGNGTVEAEDVPEYKMEPVPLPEPEPREVVLTRVELLEAENLALKISGLAANKEKYVLEANQQITNFNQKITELHKKVKEQQDTLSQKYGIDFKTHQIEPETGRVLPVHPSRPS